MDPNTGERADEGRGSCEQYSSEDACAKTSPRGRCVWSQSSCLRNTCAFPQVKSFDTSQSDLQLSAPKLSVPDALLVEAMTSALQSGKGALNEILDENALRLPVGVSKYLVPPPGVTMFAQHSESDQHGFIDMVSFCGSELGQKPCVTQHQPARTTGGGGADCLDTASLAITSPLDSSSAGDVAEPQSSYTAHGVEFSMGNYMFVQADRCLDPAQCNRQEFCSSNLFENGKCSSFNRRTCVDDVLMHETYEYADCTGNETKNVTKRIVDYCNTSTKVWCWNADCSNNKTQSFSETVVCPRVLSPPVPTPNSSWEMVLVIVAAVIGSGVCVAASVYAYRKHGMTIADKCESMRASTGLCCGRIAECTQQPMRAGYDSVCGWCSTHAVQASSALSTYCVDTCGVVAAWNSRNTRNGTQALSERTQLCGS